MAFLKKLGNVFKFLNKKKRKVKSGFFKEVASLKFIEKNDVKKWTSMHVLEWIECLRYNKEHGELIKSVIQKEGIDGNDLINLTFSNVEILLSKLDPAIYRDKFWICLNNLKKTRKFNQLWANVFYKLFRVGNNENLQYLEEYASILSDKKRFYDRYFSFFVDYFLCKENELKITNWEKKKQKIKSKKEVKKLDIKISKLQKQVENENKRIAKKFEEVTGKKFWDGNYGSMCGIRRTKIKLLPCKVIISEIFDDKEGLKKKIRDYLSPIVQLLPKYKESTKFGLFHTSIIIGPWYLHWNFTEIVVPKRSFGSQKALISYDMPVLLNISYEDLKELVQKIVDIVFFWNTQVFYAQKRNPVEYKGNCQDFIDDIFQAINISPDILFQGMFGSFIKNMRKKGNAELVFCPSDKFRTHFKLSWKKKVFDDHVELDKFFRKIMSQLPEVKESYMEEYYMLKSFDRAFWLRHIRSPKEKKFMPLEMDYKLPEHLRGCPFKDPRETMSYI